jgi:hypothetical protein
MVMKDWRSALEFQGRLDIEMGRPEWRQGQMRDKTGQVLLSEDKLHWLDPVNRGIKAPDDGPLE